MKTTMRITLRHQRGNVLSMALLSVLAGTLSTAALFGLMPRPAQAAIPAGKVCPTAGDTWSDTLGACMRPGNIDPATGIMNCDPGYIAINSAGCEASPIDGTSGNQAPPPPADNACQNPIDKLAQGGLCSHPSNGQPCGGVYLSDGKGNCSTSATLSKPGSEQGPAKGINGDDSSQTGNPRCAVMTLGEIACPSNVGAATNNCYVRDPTGKKPSQWVNTGCGSAEFKKAATVYSLDCSVAKTAGCSTTTTCDGSGTKCDIIKSYVDPIVKILSGLVGVGVAATIILSGIQYSASGSSPQQVEAARKRITVAVCVLIGYFLLFAFLNWLIPGGI